jgi:hypothetical protein
MTLLGDQRGGVPISLPIQGWGERGADRLVPIHGCHLQGIQGEIGPQGFDVSGYRLPKLKIPMHRGHLLRFDRGQATDLIPATLRRRKEGHSGKEMSRGSVFTWIQCCPIAIDGESTDEDGEIVHAADTPSSTAAFWGARQRAGDRRDGRRRAEHGAGLSGARCCGRGGVAVGAGAAGRGAGAASVPGPPQQARCAPLCRARWSALVREMKRPAVNLSRNINGVGTERLVAKPFRVSLSAGLWPFPMERLGRVGQSVPLVSISAR